MNFLNKIVASKTTTQLFRPMFMSAFPVRGFYYPDANHHHIDQEVSISNRSLQNVNSFFSLMFSQKE